MEDVTRGARSGGRVVFSLAGVYLYGYIDRMKEVEFLGDSLKAIIDFPKNARQSAGRQLMRVQKGLAPNDFKPMPSIGKGVEEIRIREESGAYRVIYTARLSDAVYVLHAFQKRTQKTSPRDLEIAKVRFNSLMRGAR